MQPMRISQFFQEDGLINMDATGRSSWIVVILVVGHNIKSNIKIIEGQ